jgi:hypothetical protein
MAMWDLSPLLHLTKDVVTGLEIDGDSSATTFRVTAHEDIQGCLRLAKMEQGRMAP